MKTTDNFRATVIIPTYNRSQLLDFTLHSLTKQSIGSGQIEVIVVDDGSNDDTVATVERYRSALAITYLFQDDRGNRTGQARNIAIARATTDLCIFVDSGMLLHSDCVAAHLASQQEYPNTAYIGYAFGFEEFNEFDEALQTVVDTRDPDQAIAYFTSINKYFDMRDPYYRKYGDRLETLPAPWVFFWTCNVSVPTQRLREVGGFDESFDQTWGFEDIELAYRLFMSGSQIRLNRQAVAIHFPHPKEDLYVKAYSQQRNKLFFHRKHNSAQSRRYLNSSCLTFNDDLIRQPITA